MSRKGKKSRGPRQPRVKGFRPGKEPAHLRARQAKAELGENATWARKAMIDAVADRSPGEVGAQVDRWSLVLLLVAGVPAVSGAFLYRWAVPAGIVLHLLTVVVLFAWFRLRRQRAAMVDMARSVGRRS